MERCSSGFYCGQRAFQMILDYMDEREVFVIDEVTFSYNLLIFHKDKFAEDSAVIGVGIPYSEIAERMSEIIKGK